MRQAHPDGFKEDLASLFAMLAQQQLRPRIAQRIALQAGEVAEAHAALETGHRIGAVVIVPTPGGG
jgi:NADPH:quinone reductase-like Zn-dependent oxidoreductase